MKLSKTEENNHFSEYYQCFDNKNNPPIFSVCFTTILTQSSGANSSKPWKSNSAKSTQDHHKFFDRGHMTRLETSSVDHKVELLNRIVASNLIKITN